jgi:hypothetical protein
MVINYSRRRRGESGDTLPYDVQREIEDLAALINIVGGAAHVYGVQSGAALAPRPAAPGVPITSTMGYDGCRIRAFIPLLVERASSDRLRLLQPGTDERHPLLSG